MQRMTSDGATVMVEGLDPARIYDWDEHLWFRDGTWEGALSIHPRGIAEVEIVETMRGRVTRTTPYRGGEVILGLGLREKGESRIGVVAWRGPHHCVTTHVTPEAANLPTAISLFSKFRLEDHPEGLVLFDPPGKPGRGVITRHSLVTGFKGEPTLIEIRPVRDNLNMLPRGAGMRVAGGELWRQQYPDMTDQVDLMLLSETALTVISGFESGTVGIQSGVNAGTSMRVDWAAA